MKTSTSVVIMALAIASLQSIWAQPATPEQIEAARQYLRTGRFSINRPAARPSVRSVTPDTNGIPGVPSSRNSLRYGTKPKTALQTPSNKAPSEGSLTPEEEREARQLLQGTRPSRITPAYAAPSASPVIAPTPALPPATPPVVTALPIIAPPVVTAPPPVSTPAPPVVSIPAIPPRVAPPVVAAPPTTAIPPAATTPLNPEAEARRLLDQQRMANDPARVEALKVQQEIRDAQAAQTSREQSFKAQEDAERMKEIARIEAEVLKAKARREERQTSGTIPPAVIPAIPPPASAPIPATPPPITTPPPAVTTAPPPVTSIPPAVTAPSPAFQPPAAAAPPAETVAPSVRPPPVVQPTLTPDMEMKARELLEKQMAVLAPYTPPSEPPPVSPPLAGPRAVMPAVTTPVVPPRAVEATRPDPAADALLRQEAIRRAEAEAKAREEAAKWEKEQQNRLRNAVKEPTKAPPATTPPPATSGLKTKQDRLAALLQSYKADQITAAQYHQERARILAEP